MTDRGLALRDRLLMQTVALLYIVVAAQSHDWHYIFFPGLAALSHDVLTRPWGKWASQPGRLIVTPTLGAATGTLITRIFPYGVLAILLVVTASVLILALLRSNIAPAIAAGILPLFLGIESWLYPVSVGLSLVLLVAILLPWQKYCRKKYQWRNDFPTTIDDDLEALPHTSVWLLPFFGFVTIMAFCATASGLRLILFPPLVVIAYEMFAHPSACPWAGRPLVLPAACVLTSTVGWAVTLLGSRGVAAACAMVCCVITLRVLRLQLPPALALGLLPLVIDSPNIKYPISVAIGTGALTLAFQLYHRWVSGQGRAGQSVSDNMRSG